MLTEALRLPFTKQDDRFGMAGVFVPVPLAFAWTRSNDVPLILGHVNFIPGIRGVFLSRSRVL
jgi:hypothetical protein